MVLVVYKPTHPIILLGLLVMAIHFLQAGRKRATRPGAEASMTTTIEFITALFCQVDEQLHTIPKHPEAHLWPSEVVTVGLLHALKGVGNRPFYRWLTRDYRPLFPRLPERTRLFRLLKTHQDWTRVFLAAPTVLGVIDTYGIELIHPIREGRTRANWPQRRVEPSLDCGWETVSFIESVGVDRGVGVCHRACR